MTEFADGIVDEQAAKDALLEAALPNIVFDGWSDATLRVAGNSLGMTEAAVGDLFPNGPAELRNWLDDWADRNMVAAYEAGSAQALRTHQRVAACIQARLNLLAPYREAVRLALAARFNPFGAVEASRAVYRTVDTIWYAIGDASTDFSFYTKRGILAGIYSAAVLYWLNDRSEGSADTRDFVERRLAQIGGAPSLKARVRATLRTVTAPFEVLKRDTGR
jgi:ubiquinone biosynthesis protein COQ9